MALFRQDGEFVTVWIDNLALIKREPVVRCQYCKFEENGLCFRDRSGYSDSYTPFKVNPDDFCSWGEKVEE